MKLLGTYLLGTALAVCAGLGWLAYTEHAVVKLPVTLQRIEVDGVSLGGGSSSEALAITKLEASVTERKTFASSGLVPIPATSAQGRVVFMCSPMSACPSGYTVGAGAIVETTSGVQYRTLSTASFPSCAPSAPINVAAVVPGAAGNAGAGAVGFGQFPSYIHVNNPWPIAGGADAQLVHVVQQSDEDAASQTLTAQVSSELAAQLQARAGGLSYVPSSQPAPDIRSDARAGDAKATFIVSVTGTVRAIAFSADEANALLSRALSQKVGAGYRLASSPVQNSYSVQDGSPTGETLMGSAVGYRVPSLDPRALAAALRGLSVSEAKHRLHQVLPGASPDIQITPVALPWLPIFADRISIEVLTSTIS
jgi:hypothetical protein